MDVQMLSARARNSISNMGGAAYIAQNLGVMDDGCFSYAWMRLTPNCGPKTCREIVAYLIATGLTPAESWSSLSLAEVNEINGYLVSFGWSGPMVDRVLHLDREKIADEVAYLQRRIARLDERRRESEDALARARYRLKNAEVRP